ncbi:hypothetical protein TRSC58_07207 [Trypanosoma rangeli SC58]|uniref:Uncharacterized protein n=1 Tax=Trypanosoma rangeli SC58 TaxID=429131 RepID=A0A061IVY2_TRYRA|nr:hypothetical protein TRSC58_07207 [Trypanosoma rangeli SC58]
MRVVAVLLGLWLPAAVAEWSLRFVLSPPTSHRSLLFFFSFAPAMCVCVYVCVCVGVCAAVPFAVRKATRRGRAPDS